MEGIGKNNRFQLSFFVGRLTLKVKNRESLVLRRKDSPPPSPVVAPPCGRRGPPIPFCAVVMPIVRGLRSSIYRPSLIVF